jgi:hypothetical protein
MAKFTSLYDLETLFSEKLQEKYKLNIRDLKKAFARFDKDNNGLLDLKEMTDGIKLFLNGVQESQVKQLVSKYDVNGDGKISYEEFLQLISTRGAIDPNENIDDGNNNLRGKRPASSDVTDRYLNRHNILNDNEEDDYSERPLSSRGYQDDSDERYSQMSGNYLGENTRNNNNNNNRPPSRTSTASTRDANDPAALEYRAKIYLQNLRSFLIKKANDLRLHGKVKLPVSMTMEELQESVARELLMKAFQPYTGMNDGRVHRHRSSSHTIQGVECNDFLRVLRNYQFPGTIPLKIETAQFLFDLCSYDSYQQIRIINEEQRPVADINILIGLIFNRSYQQSMTSMQPPTLDTTINNNNNNNNNTGNANINVNNLNNALSSSLGGSGTMTLSRNNNKKINHHHHFMNREAVKEMPRRLQDVSTTAGNDALQAQLTTIPLRFLSRKSRTAMAVPTKFDATTALMKSNQLPNYQLQRRHIFGLSTIHYSGNLLYALSTPPDVFSSTNNNNNHVNGNDFIDSATIIYTSAALSVIHHLPSNRQIYMNQHHDDITCLTISNDQRLAATGCIGKRAVAIVWRINLTSGGGSMVLNNNNNNNRGGGGGGANSASSNNSDGSNDIVCIVGEGFFERGINALAFSYDNRYLIGIGCDDYSTLGIFDITTQSSSTTSSSSSPQKLIEIPTQHGIPPQITWLRYCVQGHQYCEYIVRDMNGPCDLFVTTGEHHLRLWAYQRNTGRLEYKRLTMSTNNNQKKSAVSLSLGGVNAPKVYTCADFIACDDKSYDVIASGSNGYLYLFRRGNYIGHNRIMRKGRIQCLVIYFDKVFIGGMGGVFCMVDGRTLQILQQYHLLGDIIATPKPMKRPGSAADVQKMFLKQPSKQQSRPSSVTPGMRRANTPSNNNNNNNNNSVAAGKASNDINRPSSLISRDDSGYGKRSSNNNNNIFGGGENEEDETTNENELDSGGVSVVTGIAIVNTNHTNQRPSSSSASSRGGGGAYLSANISSIYAIVSLGTGKIVRVDLSPTTTTTTTTTSSSTNSNKVIEGNRGRDLLYYHVGPVWGLATDTAPSTTTTTTPNTTTTHTKRLAVTVGDDRKLMVWDTVDRVLLAKASIPTIARCVAFDSTTCFVGVGCTSGALYIYFISERMTRGNNSHNNSHNNNNHNHHPCYYEMDEVAYRKDAKQEITCLQFAPNNSYLACGSRDDTIYIYQIQCHVTIQESSQRGQRKSNSLGNCVLRAYCRLKGHSSSITHLDWSYDSQLLRSTCQAYELLCWDIDTGKLAMNAPNISDIHWRTHHCVLGFHVMGIWPPYSDGTDINAVSEYYYYIIIIYYYYYYIYFFNRCMLD